MGADETGASNDKNHRGQSTAEYDTRSDAMTKVLSTVSLFAVVFSIALAQDEFIPDPGQSAGKQEQTDEQKKREDALKKYEELTKDATKFEGYFTVWQKKKDLYFELKPEQLGKYWLFQGAIRMGADDMDLAAGMPLGRDFQLVDAFRFERRDDDLWLYVPNLQWRWLQDDPFALAASRAFPEAVLESYRIEVEHPDTKTIMIKVNELFYGELLDLSQRITAALGRPYQLDRNKSRVNTISALPENVLVRMDLFYSSPRGGGGNPMQELLALLGLSTKSHLADPRSLPLGVSFLIYPRPESDYMPRFADPRIGYFTTDYFDHGRFWNLDRTTRLVNRWNLQKKDPNAELSEPVKPIVWYVDNSIPDKWKPAVRDGILRWNKAFEAIGYKNAIVVKDVPKDEDWDHADMRFNVVRFFASDQAGYAVALFRTDPFTGEILNASINCDNSVLMFTGVEYDLITAPARDLQRKKLESVVHSDKSEPEFDFRKLIEYGMSHVDCQIGPEKLREAVWGWNALELLFQTMTQQDRDRYIADFISDIIAHEMGHCLGLRHNFVASTQLSLEDLGNPDKTAKYGTSSSVMDYVPLNIAAVAKGRGNYFSPTIGEYDFLAIKWGYGDVDGITPRAQQPHLMRIAQRASLPGLGFMTDENADSFDPFVVRFDLSSNPIEAFALSIDVTKKLLRTAEQRLPLPGRPYSDLTRVVNSSMRRATRDAVSALRFVGGIHGRRDFKGDPGQQNTLAPVDSRLQRLAVNLAVRELLVEDAFPLSEKVLLNLSTDPNSPTYSDQPIKDAIAGMQQMVVTVMLSASTLDRVANNAYKLSSQPNAFTLSELYGKIAGAVFSEVGTGRSIGPLRRDLQRFVVEVLTTQALSRPGQLQEDARMIAWDTLVRLQRRYEAARSNDDKTAMHLRDMARRIDRALKSQVTNIR